MNYKELVNHFEKHGFFQTVEMLTAEYDRMGSASSEFGDDEEMDAKALEDHFVHFLHHDVTGDECEAGDVLVKLRSGESVKLVTDGNHSSIELVA